MYLWREKSSDYFMLVCIEVDDDDRFVTIDVDGRIRIRDNFARDFRPNEVGSNWERT